MSFECPPTHHRFKVGATTFELPTRYHLVRPVGSGAYGVVIAADDNVGQRRVAIKKVRKTGPRKKARTSFFNRNGVHEAESGSGLLLYFMVLVVRRVSLGPIPTPQPIPAGVPTFTPLYTHVLSSVVCVRTCIDTLSVVHVGMPRARKGSSVA